MAGNKELIQKADIALGDLSSGGKLNNEQTNRFIRQIIDAPTIINSVRTVAMTAPTMNINKIGFGSRILRAAVSSTPLLNTYTTATSGTGRVKPDISQVQLTTKEVIAEIQIPYDVLEDNIEGGNVAAGPTTPAGGLQGTLVDLLAERSALDLEELIVKGDTASGTDAYLALMDGYLKQITGTGNAGVLVDAGAATFSKDVIKAGVKGMPDRFLRDRSSMIHFVSVDNETELRDTYGNRQTALGDQHVQGAMPLYVFGSKVQGAAMMPAANGLYCNPNNLIFGIQRNVQIEYDKDIRSRLFIVVLTCRVAVAIEEATAVVKYTNIG
jgi:hypothetical protein